MNILWDVHVRPLWRSSEAHVEGVFGQRELDPAAVFGDRQVTDRHAELHEPFVTLGCERLACRHEHAPAQRATAGWLSEGLCALISRRWVCRSCKTREGQRRHGRTSTTGQGKVADSLPAHGCCRVTPWNAAVNPVFQSTSLTLLERVRAHDEQAWIRLSRLYGPLVYRWARQAGLQEQDAADVGQEVFLVVIVRIGDFHRDRPGDSFRGWLRGITTKKLKEFFRRRAAGPPAAGGSDANLGLMGLPNPTPPDSADDLERELSRGLVHRAAESIRQEFTETTWQAFWRMVAEKQSAVEIARDLQLTPKAVRQAKYRVLRRMRLELDGSALGPQTG